MVQSKLEPQSQTIRAVAAQPAASAAVCQRGEKLPPRPPKFSHALTPERKRKRLFGQTPAGSACSFYRPQRTPRVTRTFASTARGGRSCFPRNERKGVERGSRMFEWTKEVRSTGSLPPKWKGSVYQLRHVSRFFFLFLHSISVTAARGSIPHPCGS